MVGVFLLAPSGAFPAPESSEADFKVEQLVFGDWIQTVKNQIDDAFNPAETQLSIGASLKEKLEQIGQKALEKLVSAATNLEEALDKVVQEILPLLIWKMKSAAATDSAGLEAAADAVLSILKKLGAKALEQAVKWIQQNQDKVGEVLEDLILSKIKGILNGGFDVAAFSFTDKAIEYLKEKIVELMKLAYKEAVILADNIIYYLKTFGIPALKAALEYIKEMQCDLGEMVYKMLHNKLNAALGIEDEAYLFEVKSVKSLREIEMLSLKDWLESVVDKIGDIVEAGKQIGKDAGEAIKDLGQDALDKLVQASANIAAAKEKFVAEVLPKIMDSLKALADKGEEVANKVIDGIVVILKKVGSTGLDFAMEWLENNKDELGKNIYDKIVAKIEEALTDIGFEGGLVAVEYANTFAAEEYGMLDTAEEYVKDAIMKAAYAGYDAAVYLFDKMIEFLKVFGIGALRLAEKLVEANKCLVGAYIYSMAMSKVKAAIKAAAIAGVIG